MDNYIEYRFQLEPLQPWQEILLAQLAEIPFETFEETNTGLNAYIKKSEDQIDFVKKTVDQLALCQIEYQRKEIETVNWNKEWESNFSPLEIKEQIHIRAEFHKKKDFPYEIVIQPKMSFGTGHHETTTLMLEHLLELEVKDLDVLDMGCGTAILGIFTKMRGANYVEGIDIDEWAYENAKENCQRNQMDCTIKQGDISLLGDRKFDLILANINKNILIKDMANYVAHLRASGTLILSGLYHFDLDDILDCCQKNGLNYLIHKQKNNWIAIKFVNSPNE